MTSIKPAGRKARRRRLRARSGRAFWLATVALAALATPAAWAQEPPQPAPDEPVVTAPRPPATADDPAQPAERSAVPKRGFVLTPTIGFEIAVTDNVRLTEHDRKADVLFRPMLRLDALLDHGRATGQGYAQVFYDQYVHTNDFNGASIEAEGAASYQLAPELLSLDLHGVITNGRTSNFGAPAIDRSGVEGRVQVAIWDIGPRLTAPLGQFADFLGVARFSQVYYSVEDGSRITTPLPPDDNIVDVLARVDTGKRFRGYELLTIAQYQKDDHGYDSIAAVQSAYVNVDPVLRLIGRAGYERIRQQGISDIEAPVLSAGVEITPNSTSRILLEGGQRFNRAAWSAHADVSLAQHVFLAADYSEAIQPDQVFVANSFQQFVEQSLALPQPIAPARFQVQDNIYAETSYNKVADLTLLLKNPRTSLELTARYSDREFLRTHAHDRTALATVTLKHALRPDLDGVAEVSYARTYASPLYGPSQSYGVNARLDYRANSTTNVTASYAYARGEQLFTGGETIDDNTFLIAIRKRF